MKSLRFFGMTLLMFILAMNFTACNQNNDNYNVEFNNGIIHVTMKCPTIGIIGINKVSFDGFTEEDIEKEIFEGIRNRDYSGNYEVYVTLKFKDEYGNYYESDEKVHVCTLNSDDVKRYSSYSYFKGKVKLGESYPWVHKYSKH